jgi:hypothetical protein
MECMGENSFARQIYASLCPQIITLTREDSVPHNLYRTTPKYPPSVLSNQHNQPRKEMRAGHDKGNRTAGEE